MEQGDEYLVLMRGRRALGCQVGDSICYICGQLSVKQMNLYATLFTCLHNLMIQATSMGVFLNENEQYPEALK